MFGTIVADAAQSAARISAAVSQQSVGIVQIRPAMRDISETSARALASTRQTEETARDLDRLGLGLQRMLQGGAAA